MILAGSTGDGADNANLLLANLARYAIIVFAFALGFQQMGIGKEIVVTAFALVLGAICLALALTGAPALAQRPAGPTNLPPRPAQPPQTLHFSKPAGTAPSVQGSPPAPVESIWVTPSPPMQPTPVTTPPPPAGGVEQVVLQPQQPPPVPAGQQGA